MVRALTTEEAKSILHSSYKPLVLLALSYVNLYDRELNTLILRHMRGLTQEETAEYLDRAKNTIQLWEASGLKKCAEAWKRVPIVREIQNLESK